MPLLTDGSDDGGYCTTSRRGRQPAGDVFFTPPEIPIIPNKGAAARPAVNIREKRELLTVGKRGGGQVYVLPRVTYIRTKTAPSAHAGGGV